MLVAVGPAVGSRILPVAALVRAWPAVVAVALRATGSGRMRNLTVGGISNRPPRSEIAGYHPVPVAPSFPFQAGRGRRILREGGNFRNSASAKGFNAVC